MIAAMARFFASVSVACLMLGALRLACSSLAGAGESIAQGSAPLPAASSANTLGMGARTIRFSGYIWRIRNTAVRRGGPGPNYFSSRRANVWLDGHGRLHLRAVKRGGRWYCAEVFSARSFGYGSYSFTLASRVNKLDRNAVLGLFTWDGAAPAYAYREIDIEFSRWGVRSAPDAQYVVQPWQHAGNEHRFNLAPRGLFSTHSFHWSADRVLFSSSRGRSVDSSRALQSWAYSGADVPPAGAAHARINLWLVNGKPPSSARSVEIVVEAFRFVPEP
jgi:hypothetical protein